MGMNTCPCCGCQKALGLSVRQHGGLTCTLCRSCCDKASTQKSHQQSIKVTPAAIVAVLRYGSTVSPEWCDRAEHMLCDVCDESDRLREVNAAQARTIERLDKDVTEFGRTLKIVRQQRDTLIAEDSVARRSGVRRSDRDEIARLSYKVQKASENERATYLRGRQAARKDIIREFDVPGRCLSAWARDAIDRAVPPEEKLRVDPRPLNPLPYLSRNCGCWAACYCHRSVNPNHKTGPFQCTNLDCYDCNPPKMPTPKPPQPHPAGAAWCVYTNQALCPFCHPRD